MKEIKVGISPCPNDTFVFGALIKGFIDAEDDYNLHFILEDVETLNGLSHQYVFDVVKISVANYKLVKNKYHLLGAGAALGRGVGPIVVSKRELYLEELADVDVAIPGKFTTATFLFNYFFNPTGRLVEYSYDRIINALLNEEVEAGILIHETRFVYESYGLKKVVDLGELWEKKTSLPLPLGIIVAKRELGKDFFYWFENKIRRSIEFARLYREKIWDFIKENAQELSEEVIESHIKTFVNKYTYDLTQEGKIAILKLLEEV